MVGAKKGEPVEGTTETSRGPFTIQKPLPLRGLPVAEKTCRFSGSLLWLLYNLKKVGLIGYR